MKLSIPDRWLDYEPIGKQIGSTPFVAFKVPLKKYFFTDEFSPEKKFGPSELMEKIPNLSLVIDLTNTKKYYDSNDFVESGVEYEKIFCPGHEIPRNDLILKFFDIVENFVKKKSESGGTNLIGVHCTHGINRTGFFICSYMINKLGYNSENAISEFNSARGHSIERGNYLNALKNYDLHPLKFSRKHDYRNSRYYKGGSADNWRSESKYKSNGYFMNQRSGYAGRFDSPRHERGYRNHVQNSEYFHHVAHPRSGHREYQQYRGPPLKSNSQNPCEVGNPTFEPSNRFQYHPQKRQ